MATVAIAMKASEFVKLGNKLTETFSRPGEHVWEIDSGGNTVIFSNQSMEHDCVDPSEVYIDVSQ